MKIKIGDKVKHIKDNGRFFPEYKLLYNPPVGYEDEVSKFFDPNVGDMHDTWIYLKNWHRGIYNVYLINREYPFNSKYFKKL